MFGLGRSLKQTLHVDPGVEGPLQWGTIASITTGGSFDTAGVYLDTASGQPGATITTGIPWINGYQPTVGDVVLILRMGGPARTQRIILGPLETANQGMTQGGVENVTSLVSAGPITAPASQGGTPAPTSYGSVPIKFADTTLGAAAASYTVSSIPSTFSRLRGWQSARSDLATTVMTVNLRFNGDSTAVYSWQNLQASGAAASGNDQGAAAVTSIAASIIPAANAPANIFGGSEFDVYDYTSTSHHKAVTSFSVDRENAIGAGSMRANMLTGEWANATIAAVNSYTVIPNSNNLVTGSRFVTWLDP